MQLGKVGRYKVGDKVKALWPDTSEADYAAAVAGYGPAVAAYETAAAEWQAWEDAPDQGEYTAAMAATPEAALADLRRYLDLCAPGGGAKAAEWWVTGAGAAMEFTWQKTSRRTESLSTYEDVAAALRLKPYELKQPKGGKPRPPKEPKAPQGVKAKSLSSSSSAAAKKPRVRAPRPPANASAGERVLLKYPVGSQVQAKYYKEEGWCSAEVVSVTKNGTTLHCKYADGDEWKRVPADCVRPFNLGVGCRSRLPYALTPSSRLPPKFRLLERNQYAGGKHGQPKSRAFKRWPQCSCTPERGCGPNCMNRTLLIECPPGVCSCLDGPNAAPVAIVDGVKHCANTRLQRRAFPEVVVFETAHGCGHGLALGGEAQVRLSARCRRAAPSHHHPPAHPAPRPPHRSSRAP